MVDNGGTVDQFGDAQLFGSTATTKPIAPVSAIVPTSDGKGYWLLEPDDWSYSFSAPSPYDLAPSAAITTLATSQVGPDPDTAQGAYCNPYGPCEQWCALFVTWIWAHAGIPVPSIPFTGNVYAWAAAHGRIVPGSVLPAPGDAVLYGTGPQSTATSVHTGLVVEAWPDDAVVTVEGDAGPGTLGTTERHRQRPVRPRGLRLVQRRPRVRRRPARALTGSAAPRSGAPVPRAVSISKSSLNVVGIVSQCRRGVVSGWGP